MKKIVYCNPHLCLPDGIERVLTSKANYLAEKAGYEVTLILTDDVGRPPYYPLSPKVRVIQLGINFYQIPSSIPLWKKYLLHRKKLLRYKKELTKILMEIRPYITVSLLRREINFLTDIPDGSRKIAEFHLNRQNCRSMDRPSRNPLKRMTMRLWMLQLIRKLRKLDRFIVLTEEDRMQWKELSNTSVIPNPLSFESDTVSTLTAKKVIAVGRYAYQKGFDRLLRVWAAVHKQHPDWELHIYGRGNIRPLQDYRDRLQLQTCCQLHPYAPDIAEKYRESSLLVLSSRYEGFGLVLTEAMQCGVPCVSFACPCGPRDIIRHGIDGYLAENGDEQQLARQICMLIENPTLRQNMGKEARRSSLRYREEEIMKKWTELFDSLLAK